MAKYIVRFEDLVAIARRVGVKVVAAPSSHRGHIGEMGTVAGVTCHYTGTPNSYRPGDEYPDYNVVKEGRAGLRNSLSAFGLGRHSTIYVFSEDLSWHAGVWLWEGITDGNGHFLGIEAAGVGDWTDWQRLVYPRLVASILLFIDASVDMAPTHAQGAMPRGRKVDFITSASLTGFLADLHPGGLGFRDAVAWLMTHPAYININYGSEEDELDDTQAKQLEAIYNAIGRGIGDPRDDPAHVENRTLRPASFFVAWALYFGDKIRNVQLPRVERMLTEQSAQIEALRSTVASLAGGSGKLPSKEEIEASAKAWADAAQKALADDLLDATDGEDDAA